MQKKKFVRQARLPKAAYNKALLDVLDPLIQKAHGHKNLTRFIETKRGGGTSENQSADDQALGEEKKAFSDSDKQSRR